MPLIVAVQVFLKHAVHVYTVSQKSKPFDVWLMFDNNFGKCGQIFKILYQLIRTKILYVNTTTISTAPAIYCYTTL